MSTGDIWISKKDESNYSYINLSNIAEIELEGDGIQFWSGFTTDECWTWTFETPKDAYDAFEDLNAILMGPKSQRF